MNPYPPWLTPMIGMCQGGLDLVLVSIISFVYVRLFFLIFFCDRKKVHLTKRKCKPIAETGRKLGTLAL